MHKILILYHKIDYDGLVSCIIVKNHFKEENSEVNELGWNYSDQLPDIDKLLSENDKIIMVDISFPKPVMKKLLEKKGENFIWIDHHITAINDSVEEGYDTALGIRDINYSACELCWKYFIRKKVPEFVQYINDYDIWNKARNSWTKRVLPLQYGLKTDFGLNIYSLEDKFDLFIKDPEFLNKYIEKGKNILKYTSKVDKAAVKSHSFPVELDGNLRGVCMLTPISGSIQFKSVAEDYDICITLNISQSGYTLGMYSLGGDIGDFNCGEYVRKKFGNGGGHAGTAGCSITFEQFTEIIKNRKI